jgi:hypothetical protein
LLEFDNNGILATPIIPSGDEAIEPAGCKRELELQNYAVVQQLALLEDLRYRAKRVAPRIHLARSRLKTEFVKEGIAQFCRNSVLGGVFDQTSGGS